MRGDVEPFEPPTAEELAEAASLRDRLEGAGAGTGGDVERTLALLAAASAGDAPVLDEVTVRRIRRELVGAASRRRFPVLHAAFQVAAALLVAALLAVGRAPAPPSAALLAEREAEAREAIARVLLAPGAASGGATGVSASALASLTRARTAELFSSVDSERLSQRVGLSSAGSDSVSGLSGVSLTPTPGGAS
jgi:hypothetical protein